MISKKVLGVKVNKDMVNESITAHTGRAMDWLNRPILKKYWCLYIDGTNFRIQRRSSTEKEPSLVVLGIDEDGHRSILAIMDFPKITGHFRLSGLSPLGGVNRGRKSQKNQTSV